MNRPGQSFALTIKLSALLFAVTLLNACGGGAEVGSSDTDNGGGSVQTPGTGSGSGGPIATATYAVSWEPVADPRVSAYNIYYASAPLDRATDVRSVTVGNGANYTFSPGSAGISAGTVVYLAVSAVGGGTESPISDQASVTVE